jgi:hypothetical protein
MRTFAVWSSDPPSPLLKQFLKLAFGQGRRGER